ncbi:MAG: tRNA (guanosine(46)-N7)-methyltransferase TrmB [Gammaproteobacteria bacterium]|nr:tRNA (guanosine(46)-N7)-methyltransferase TrmB [Gammaproteobacteria bacterium]
MRKIRSFARRSGRMTDSQKKALAAYWDAHGINYEDQILNFKTLFNREAPTNIEIGFGMGENILSVAQNRPEENFIGIEVHQPAVGHVLNQINELGLTNLRVMNHDAVEVFTQQIDNLSLNSVSVFFPDPWHKSNHHKRRLVSPKFAELLATKIAKKGHAYLATDWEHYAIQMLDVFTHNKHFKNLSPTHTYCKRMEFRPITKFERRGLRLGHGVWDLIFEKL